jgi:tetratricopeptide (TPR) repeat protein
MKAALLALLLAAPPIENGPLFALYAQGQYEEAMRQGAAAGSAASFAIAARAAMADAMMRPTPCLECLKRGEVYARRAIAADTDAPDGHVWLAAALGYEARIVGLLRARLDDDPAQAKTNLDDALRVQPDNAYALAALGGWNVEIVRTGGKFLANKLYSASAEQGIALFDRAIRTAPRNVAVRYQIGLSLAGLNSEIYRSRIDCELEAAIHATPETAYEKFVQGRAAELLTLLKLGDRDAFEAKLHIFQGYP